MLNLLGNFVCIGYSFQSLERELVNLLEVEGEDGAADDGDVHHVPDVPGKKHSESPQSSNLPYISPQVGAWVEEHSQVQHF